MPQSLKKDYTRIGLAVVLGTLAIIFALIYIGGTAESRNMILAETYSTVPVSGLSVGSEVNFRGVKVGTVKKISFIGSEYPDSSPEDAAKIYIQLALQGNTFLHGQEESGEERLIRQIRRGLHATVTASGITGLSHIELNLVEPSAIIFERLSWQPETPCIPPKPSMIDNIADVATRVMNGFDKMDFDRLWTNVNSVMETSASVLKHFDGILERESGPLHRLLQNLNETADSLEDFVRQLNDNPSLLIRSREFERLDEMED